MTVIVINWALTNVIIIHIDCLLSVLEYIFVYAQFGVSR